LAARGPQPYTELPPSGISLLQISPRTCFCYRILGLSLCWQVLTMSPSLHLLPHPLRFLYDRPPRANWGKLLTSRLHSSNSSKAFAQVSANLTTVLLRKAAKYNKTPQFGGPDLLRRLYAISRPPIQVQITCIKSAHSGPVDDRCRLAHPIKMVVSIQKAEQLVYIVS
jgi:hypothetical protein